MAVAATISISLTISVVIPLSAPPLTRCAISIMAMPLPVFVMLPALAVNIISLGIRSIDFGGVKLCILSVFVDVVFVSMVIVSIIFLAMIWFAIYKSPISAARRHA
eukprot:TRINITY_DN6400_c0_g1_i1.p3 TRINITY_DN6400_c0_g1~~TRINITY_DN6400_c0_g1_i1.p3  ORF type:complete len:106 (+),score=16.65 TRINITY_DN6400_c0_g1_i1:760-1077(+)